jgi:hypothetical protein
MTKISWNIEKNRQLKADERRSICFEDIVVVLKTEGFLEDIASLKILKSKAMQEGIPYQTLIN